MRDTRFGFNNSQHLRELRETKGVTQHRIGALLDVPQSRISEYENGKRLLRYAQAEKLAHYFKVPVTEFRKEKEAL